MNFHQFDCGIKLAGANIEMGRHEMDFNGTATDEVRTYLNIKESNGTTVGKKRKQIGGQFRRRGRGTKNPERVFCVTKAEDGRAGSSPSLDWKDGTEVSCSGRSLKDLDK